MRKGTLAAFVLVVAAVSVLMLFPASNLTAQNNVSPLPTGIGGPLLLPTVTLTPTLQADTDMQTHGQYKSYLPVVSSGGQDE